MRLDRASQERFLRRIKNAMRTADAFRPNGEPRQHSAPALTGQASLRQGIAEAALQHARSVTRGFAYSHQDHPR